MKPSAIAALLAAPLALGACQGETEEAPDISEAIPLDLAPSEDADAESVNDGEEGSAQAPNTMESGSNPPGMTSPPPGSKVQPVKQ